MHYTSTSGSDMRRDGTSTGSLRVCVRTPGSGAGRPVGVETGSVLLEPSRPGLLMVAVLGCCPAGRRPMWKERSWLHVRETDDCLREAEEKVRVS